MKNMYIYSFTLSIPSIPSHSYSSDSSSTWIAPSAPSEAHSREFIESCRERNKCAYPESLCVGCSGQKQTSQAPPAGWAQPFWLPAQLHPWAIQGGSTQCKVPEMGLEPGQCQRERMWRTRGRCYRHGCFQVLKCLDESKPLEMRIIKRKKEGLGKSHNR